MNPAPSEESYHNFIKNYDKANGPKSGLAGFFMYKGHQILEKTLPENSKSGIILEVGSGTGHHFEHVKNFENYYLTDANEEMLKLAKKNLAKFSRQPIFEIQNAARLTYPDGFCDRLIATHVLEHMSNPVAVLAEWDRVVKKDGFISIILPCDPGLLWRLGRHLGPRRTAVKAGISYDYLQATEHVNYITGLVTLIRHHFDERHESWYPMHMPWSDINLFYICHIRK